MQRSWKVLLTPAEQEVYRLHAGMIDAAPFESGYLPLRAMSVAELAGQRKQALADVEKLIASAEGKLRAARAKRGCRVIPRSWPPGMDSRSQHWPRPHRLRKDVRYRAAAQAVRDFLAKSYGMESARAFARAGESQRQAWHWRIMLMLRSGSPSGRRSPATRAMSRWRKTVASAAWERFYGPKGFRLEENTLLVAETGQDVLSDGPMPSPSAVLADASLRLAEKTGDKALHRQVLAALNSGSAVDQRQPALVRDPGQHTAARGHCQTLTASGARLRGRALTGNGLDGERLAFAHEFQFDALARLVI